MGANLIRAIGYPDEFQARLIIIDAYIALGSKRKFCELIGINGRYLDLILEWRRSPAHPAILKHFGWKEIFIDPEEL